MAEKGYWPEFQLNVSEWSIFKARLANYFEANGVAEDKKKRSILLNALDEEAYRLNFSHFSPATPEEKTYVEVVEALDNHFKRGRCPFAERFKFYEATKRKSEGPTEWAARIRRLALGCEFGGILDTVLGDKFICGYERGQC